MPITQIRLHAERAHHATRFIIRSRYFDKLYDECLALRQLIHQKRMYSKLHDLLMKKHRK